MFYLCKLSPMYLKGSSVLIVCRFKQNWLRQTEFLEMYHYTLFYILKVINDILYILRHKYITKTPISLMFIKICEIY